MLTFFRDLKHNSGACVRVRVRARACACVRVLFSVPPAGKRMGVRATAWASEHVFASVALLRAY